jgi:hypothetical protein
MLSTVDARATAEHALLNSIHEHFTSDSVLCSSVTNRLLGSKDHASVQINVGNVDKYGIYTGDYQVFCLSGAVRRQGEADFGLNLRCVEAKLMNQRVLK